MLDLHSKVSTRTINDQVLSFLRLTAVPEKLLMVPAITLAFTRIYEEIIRKATEIRALAQKSRPAAARRGQEERYAVDMCSLSLYHPPMPGPQGCEKLYCPLGLVKIRARITILEVRWLENKKYSNETVAHTPKASETQL